MLEFSPSLFDLKEIQPDFFPQRPEIKSEWPIVDATSKAIITPSECQKVLQQTTQYTHWKWPKRRTHFISDIHADAQALVSSLILSGTLKKTGIKSSDFILTSKGKKDRIIIGGDCLDKGPSNLHLLRTLHKLIKLKKNTILLAGNHDIRLFMGLKSMTQKHNPGSEHFFVRMGVKVIPLLKEVYDEYLRDTRQSLNPPSVKYCRKKLFPPKQWHKIFQEKNRKTLSPEAIQLEIKKINKKWSNFERNCQQQGLNLPMAYLAAQKCHSLFLQPDGEFYWFFNKMKLIHRDKSFLFTHAGLDDKICKKIKQVGIKKVNRLYQNLLQADLCDFYYGTVANMLRTKYRKTDPVLTKKGIKRMHRMGIHAIVHGHVRQSNGQNISLRSGMLNFECDITLDKNSRIKAGLTAHGAGITTISPKGKVKGISNDASYIKIFEPNAFL